MIEFEGILFVFGSLGGQEVHFGFLRGVGLNSGAEVRLFLVGLEGVFALRLLLIGLFELFDHFLHRVELDLLVDPTYSFRLCVEVDLNGVWCLYIRDIGFYVDE